MGLLLAFRRIVCQPKIHFSMPKFIIFLWRLYSKTHLAFFSIRIYFVWYKDFCANAICKMGQSPNQPTFSRLSSKKNEMWYFMNLLNDPLSLFLVGALFVVHSVCNVRFLNLYRVVWTSSISMLHPIWCSHLNISCTSFISIHVDFYTYRLFTSLTKMLNFLVSLAKIWSKLLHFCTIYLVNLLQVSEIKQ